MMDELQIREQAIHSYPPPDGGDKFCDGVIGWPSMSYHVYEWLPFPYVGSYRYVVPQACSDDQVRGLVEAWLRKVGYYRDNPSS